MVNQSTDSEVRFLNLDAAVTYIRILWEKSSMKTCAYDFYLFFKQEGCAYINPRVTMIK